MSEIRRNFLTFLLGFSQIYAWATTYYLPATLANIVVDEMGQSYLTIIGGFSWALLIGGLSAPKIGSWIDSEGGRRPLFTGSLLMGLGLAILSQTNNMLTWYIAWTVIGLGMALGLFNAIFATVGRLLGQESKIIIIRITLISGFATLIWPVTTYLILIFGWRTTVFLFAIPHILIWAPLYYFGIPTSVPKEIKELHTDFLAAPEKTKLIFYLLALYVTLRAMIGTTISVNIITMLEGLGLAVSASAIVASMIGPAQIIGRILEMYFGKRFDPIHSSIFWTAVLPISILLLIVAGPSASSIFATAYGMSNGVLTITMGILPLILFGSNGYARMLGKLAFPVLIAQAASPLLVAPIINSWRSIDLFILAGILGTVSLICLIYLSSIYKRETSVV